MSREEQARVFLFNRKDRIPCRHQNQTRRRKQPSSLLPSAMGKDKGEAGCGKGDKSGMEKWQKEQEWNGEGAKGTRMGWRNGKSGQGCFRGRPGWDGEVTGVGKSSAQCGVKRSARGKRKSK